MQTRNLRIAVGTSYVSFIWYRAYSVYTNSSALADWFWIAFTFLLILPSLVLIEAEVVERISRRKEAKRKVAG